MQIADRSSGGLTEGATRVARALLQLGPTTASGLADELGLSQQAVRRHLDHLLEAGLVAAGERPPYGPAPARGRGRPARLYYVTEAGREFFDQAYDDLALTALRYLAEHGGQEQISGFAAYVGRRFEQRYAGSDLRELSRRLTEDGYAAAVSGSEDDGAVQLCQHHCPVGHVAAEFPHLCEAETAAIGRILGRNVIRLATIAHGDGVCTTVVMPDNQFHRPATGRQGDDLDD